MSTMVETQTKKAEDNSGRNFFLLLITAFAANVAMLLFDLPDYLRNICILWLIVGCPVCFVLMRIWRGYVEMQLANIAHQPVTAPQVDATLWAQTEQVRATKQRAVPEPQRGVGEPRLRMVTAQDVIDTAKPKSRTTF